MTTPTAAAPWRNRIVGSGGEAPDQLLANPQNWRIHPAAQQGALASVLDDVGWVKRVLVNRRTGHIVDGHLRVELALSRQEPSVPVTYVDLSEAEEALVLASLDPLAAMAVADPAKLRELLAEVSVTDDELAAMFKALVPRLLVTDPPYGVRLDPRWRNGVYDALGESAAPYMLSHQNTDISGDTIVDWSPAFELVPTIEVAYVWHAGVHAAAVAAGLVRLRLAIRSQIIWVKEHLVISRGDYHWQHEPCWYAVREGRTAGWEGKHDLSTTWELACPKMIIGGSREEKLDHPAQKPLEAMARPIRHHRGDVYEPFVGSGTTLLAAEREGRRCYAMEVEPRYAQMAKERWEAFTGQEATRG